MAQAQTISTDQLKPSHAKALHRAVRADPWAVEDNGPEDPDAFIEALMASFSGIGGEDESTTTGTAGGSVDDDEFCED